VIVICFVDVVICVDVVNDLREAAVDAVQSAV